VILAAAIISDEITQQHKLGDIVAIKLQYCHSKTVGGVREKDLLLEN